MVTTANVGSTNAHLDEPMALPPGREERSYVVVIVLDDTGFCRLAWLVRFFDIAKHLRSHRMLELGVLGAQVPCDLTLLYEPGPAEPFHRHSHYAAGVVLPPSTHRWTIRRFCAVSVVSARYLLEPLGGCRLQHRRVGAVHPPFLGASGRGWTFDRWPGLGIRALRRNPRRRHESMDC